MPESVSKGLLGNLTRDGLGLPPRVARGYRSNEGAESPAHLDDPLEDKRSIRMLNRVRVQLQLFRQLPRRRQRLAWFRYANAHGTLELIGNLPVNRSRVVLPQLHLHASTLSY